MLTEKRIELELNKRVRLPPGTQRGEDQHSLAGEGVGGPNSDDWKEIRHSVYSVATAHCSIVIQL
jgi:hypothetical protein